MHCRRFLYVIWWIPFLSFSTEEELCGSLNSRTIYLQLGEHDTITLLNQTWFNKNTLRCTTELVTCPSCSIQIVVERLNLPQTCDDIVTLNNKTSNDNCHCGGLSIWEPTSNSPPLLMCFITQETFYTSTTRSLGVSLDFIPVNWTGDFSIRFIAKKNQNIISGQMGQHGHLNSPSFPSLYPRDFGIEHVLACTSNNCIVTVLFTDFSISPTSIMEFYDWNGQPIQLISGLLARPKPVISTGPSLTIRFFANGGTALGYKAKYHFLNNSTYIRKISTECGGVVDDSGGTIYMSDLKGYYDCIWIIQPTPSISHFKTHVYLKVTQFSGGELVIHQGQTSEDRLLEVFTERNIKDVEHVSPINKGFYIWYRGNLLPESVLSIAYSAFAYMDCVTGTDLLCVNKRCISLMLMCDSFDNCGDNSDEMHCKPEITPLKNTEYWWPYRKNAPNSDTSPGGALLALGAALTGSAVLLAVTLCRVALRMRSPPSSHAPHHIDHIRTIAHLLNIGELDERDEPPTYEPPPEYNQVVKSARPRRKRSTQRLIDQDTPSQLEVSIKEDKEMEVLEKKEQLVDIPVAGTSNTDELDQSIQLTDTISQPVSLDTTGYNEDLGLSLTLSVTSPKGCVQNAYKPWIPSVHNNSQVDTVNTPHSVLSFDTFHSSRQDFSSLNYSRQLIKSHSQDNILRLRYESSANKPKDSSSYYFSTSNFGVQKAQPSHVMNRKSLDDSDFMENCFSADFPTVPNKSADNHSQ